MSDNEATFIRVIIYLFVAFVRSNNYLYIRAIPIRLLFSPDVKDFIQIEICRSSSGNKARLSLRSAVFEIV